MSISFATNSPVFDSPTITSNAVFFLSKLRQLADIVGYLSANYLQKINFPRNLIVDGIRYRPVCMSHFFAHRGFNRRAPENSLEAFDLALVKEVEGFECDIQKIF